LDSLYDYDQNGDSNDNRWYNYNGSVWVCDVYIFKGNQ
jgi:hypothetical protein